MRRLIKSALTLFFLTFSPSIACSADANYDATLHGYVARMLIALLLLAAVGYIAAKYLPGRIRGGTGGKMSLLGAMNVGRDMIYVVRIGPQVVALFVGRTTSSVIGKWGFDEWREYESSQESGGSSGRVAEGQ